MRLDKPILQGDAKRPRFNWELYYYERIGSRYYLRITPFALILMIVAMLIGFTILIFDARVHPTQEINTNITVPNASPYSSNNTLIRQVPTIAPPSSKHYQKALPSSPTPPSSDNNINAQ
jgi:hypothetical protein